MPVLSNHLKFEATRKFLIILKKTRYLVRIIMIICSIHNRVCACVIKLIAVVAIIYFWCCHWKIEHTRICASSSIEKYFRLLARVSKFLFVKDSPLFIIVLCLSVCLSLSLSLSHSLFLFPSRNIKYAIDHVCLVNLCVTQRTTNH